MDVPTVDDTETKMVAGSNDSNDSGLGLDLETDLDQSWEFEPRRSSTLHDLLGTTEPNLPLDLLQNRQYIVELARNIVELNESGAEPPLAAGQHTVVKPTFSDSRIRDEDITSLLIAMQLCNISADTTLLASSETGSAASELSFVKKFIPGTCVHEDYVTRRRLYLLRQCSQRDDICASPIEEGDRLHTNFAHHFTNLVYSPKISAADRRHIETWPLLVQVPDVYFDKDDHRVLLFEARDCIYETTMLLGSGSFGSVYICRVMDKGFNPEVRRLCNERSAMKVVNCEEEWRKERDINEILRATMQKTPCQYITRFKRAILIREGGGLLFLELSIGGSLTNLLWSSQKCVDHRVLPVYAAQIGAAVAWLHTHCRIIHLDIKPCNVLLHDNGKLKLCDFGHAQKMNAANMVSSKGMNPDKQTKHLPPELLSSSQTPQNMALSCGVDWFSLGVTLFWISHLRFPYSYHGNDNIRTAADAAECMRKYGVGQVKFIASIPALVTDFLKKLLQPLAQQRYCSWEQVMCDPIFTNNPFLGARVPPQLHRATPRPGDLVEGFVVPPPLLPVTLPVGQNMSQCSCKK